MTVEDVFSVRGRGLVATGSVEAGEAVAGDNIGLLFAGLDNGDG
jgi:translation elongation factor EF-Tu-like GTPase